MHLLPVAQLPAALLLATALCSAAEPWLTVTVPPSTRESLPATIRMWYRLAWLGVLPRQWDAPTKPIAAMRGEDLMLSDAERNDTAWVIHANDTITREPVETYIGEWRRPTAVELARAAAVAAGLLPSDPPLQPDQLRISQRESATSWNIRWRQEPHRGSCLMLGADGRISAGRWISASCCCHCGGTSDPTPPSGGG